jgi:hypothetical protein
MKKKSLLVMVLLVVLVAGIFGGCGGGGGTSNGGASKDYPVIDDIETSVKEEVRDGEREVLFSYNNNSEYTITYLETTMKFKEDVTKDDVNEVYEKIYPDKWKEAEKEGYELADITMTAESENKVAPGETSPKTRLSVGWLYVLDISQYELMDADITTIKYIGADEKQYTIYYDHKTKEYTKDSDEGEEVNAWSDSELAKQIPQPEFDFEITSDMDNFFRIESYDVTKEELKAYIEKCKELGYTIDPNEYNGSYNAENKQGYKLSVFNQTDDADSPSYIDVTPKQ